VESSFATSFASQQIDLASLVFGTVFSVHSGIVRNSFVCHDDDMKMATKEYSPKIITLAPTAIFFNFILFFLVARCIGASVP